MEEINNKGKYIIVTILMIMCLGIGCVLGKTLLKDNNSCLEKTVSEKDNHGNDNEQIEDKKTSEEELVKEDSEEQNTNTNYWNYDNTDKMVDTMLGMIRGGCSDQKNFFITSSTTFDNMSNEVKAEIAMFNVSDKYSNKLEDKIERTFGKNKKIDLPKKLNSKYWFVSYELIDGEYKEVADGGGCTGFGNLLKTAIIEKKYSENKITYRVNIGYLVRDNAPKDGENMNIDEELHSTLYNGYDKTRVIENNIYYKSENEVVNRLLYTNKMDYILFTFVKENEVYIFDKVELVKV